ncbi:actin maturation protease-like [Macrobrachium nipponense]|uniref:actin maturation protease-like n=1 Tax=Macrobrachium nipponense TaxID=159736 RepID=UPI0030C8356B
MKIHIIVQFAVYINLVLVSGSRLPLNRELLQMGVVSTSSAPIPISQYDSSPSPPPPLKHSTPPPTPPPPLRASISSFVTTEVSPVVGTALAEAMLNARAAQKGAKPECPTEDEKSLLETLLEEEMVEGSPEMDGFGISVRGSEITGFCEI